MTGIVVPESQWVKYNSKTSYTDAKWSNLYLDNSTAAPTDCFSKRTYYREMVNQIKDSITFDYSKSKNNYDIRELTSTGTNSLAWKEHEFFSNSTTSVTAGNHWSMAYEYGWEVPVVAPVDRIRQMIRDRMAPAIHRGRKRQSLSIALDIREVRARQTLRRVIGERSYRKFIRDGFITVVPKSGLAYRIFPGHGMTEVYDRGIQVDLLCVVLNGQFPPTDSLLMRYLLILNDEGEFSKYAIKHHVSPRGSKMVLPTLVKPLTEAWSKLQVA